VVTKKTMCVPLVSGVLWASYCGMCHKVGLHVCRSVCRVLSLSLVMLPGKKNQKYFIFGTLYIAYNERVAHSRWSENDSLLVIG